MEVEKFDKEFRVRMALSHVIAGASFLDIDTPEIVSILRAVADDYEREYEKLL